MAKKPEARGRAPSTTLRAAKVAGRGTKRPPGKPERRSPPPPAPLVPGEYLLRAEPIEANAGAAPIALSVANRGDRPIQVGSHFHFFEVNRALDFDRRAAYGMRLNIAAGTAVRFEPGQTRKVELIALGGRREVWGLNGLVNGPLRKTGD